MIAQSDIFHLQTSICIDALKAISSDQLSFIQEDISESLFISPEEMKSQITDFYDALLSQNEDGEESVFKIGLNIIPKYLEKLIVVASESLELSLEKNLVDNQTIQGIKPLFLNLAHLKTQAKIFGRLDESEEKMKWAECFLLVALNVSVKMH